MLKIYKNERLTLCEQLEQNRVQRRRTNLKENYKDKIVKAINALVIKVDNELTTDQIIRLMMEIGLKTDAVSTHKFLLEIMSFDKSAILAAYEIFIFGRVNINKGVVKNKQQFRRFLSENSFMEEKQSESNVLFTNAQSRYDWGGIN